MRIVPCRLITVIDKMLLNKLNELKDLPGCIDKATDVIIVTDHYSNCADYYDVHDLSHLH